MADETDRSTCAWWSGSRRDETCGAEIVLKSERSVLMADGTDGAGGPGGIDRPVWRHVEFTLDYHHQAQPKEA